MNLCQKLVVALLVPTTLAACGTGVGGDDCLVEENVSEPTTWDCPTMTVTRTVQINDALTIEPGTMIEVAENAHILVNTGGSMTATGTGDEPIVFRGQEAAKGYWGGLAIQSKSLDNILENVVIEDTGAAGFQNNEWALALLGGGVPEGSAKLVDVTLRHGGGLGFSLSEDSQVLEGSDGLTIEDVDGVAASATADVVHQLDFGVQFGEGIGKPWVQIERGTIAEIVTWSDLGAPYRLVASPRIEEDGFLTIGAGAYVEFAQDIMIDSKSGRLAVLGEAEAPVTLTGVESIPGYWGGLTYQSVSDDNVIEHAVIEFAGGKNFQNETAALVVAGPTTSTGLVAVSDTVIRESGDRGVVIRKGGTAHLDNVTFEGNAGEDVVDLNAED